MTGLAERFGREPEVRAQAPGRVNLIGEHTDYNGGFVLPTPIPRRTTVELAARTDRRVRLASASVPLADTVEYELGIEMRKNDWADYARGVTRVLAHEGLALGGFDAFVASDLPIGGGLSSSAALCVALQRALRERFGLALDDVAVARIAQRAENEFVGAQVGIMDPLASSLGRLGEALFVDTRDLATRRVPIPEVLELVVIDSGTGHRHATGEYNRRRRECELAAERLGVAQLRDLGITDLGRIAALPDPLDRRARHVVTEDERVLQAVSALEAADGERLGELLAASHRSLRDDYEVTTPAIDALVDVLARQPGVFGARMTGGGFGGAVIALARAGTGPAAAERAVALYAEDTGETPSVIVPSSALDTSPTSHVSQGTP